ncbi:hypothetical protein L2E82_22279 [Cichorium intybus]|uniref:Uncharacterized protein n=1 Tax=Cichorium intybus TaxID=13427 RepID=A0ACB9DXM2_CICIN|nr:hypothetical protein L2E82_22279 [Cichorium intybus]
MVDDIDDRDGGTELITEEKETRLGALKEFRDLEHITNLDLAQKDNIQWVMVDGEWVEEVITVSWSSIRLHGVADRQEVANPLGDSPTPLRTKWPATRQRWIANLLARCQQV